MLEKYFECDIQIEPGKMNVLKTIPIYTTKSKFENLCAEQRSIRSAVLKMVFS